MRNRAPFKQGGTKGGTQGGSLGYSTDDDDDDDDDDEDDNEKCWGYLFAPHSMDRGREDAGLNGADFDGGGDLAGGVDPYSRRGGNENVVGVHVAPTGADVMNANRRNTDFGNAYRLANDGPAGSSNEYVGERERRIGERERERGVLKRERGVLKREVLKREREGG